MTIGNTPVENARTNEESYQNRFFLWNNKINDYLLSSDSELSSMKFLAQVNPDYKVFCIVLRKTYMPSNDEKLIRSIDTMQFSELFDVRDIFIYPMDSYVLIQKSSNLTHTDADGQADVTGKAEGPISVEVPDSGGGDTGDTPSDETGDTPTNDDGTETNGDDTPSDNTSTDNTSTDSGSGGGSEPPTDNSGDGTRSAKAPTRDGEGLGDDGGTSGGDNGGDSGGDSGDDGGEGGEGGDTGGTHTASGNASLDVTGITDINTANTSATSENFVMTQILKYKIDLSKTIPGITDVDEKRCCQAFADYQRCQFQFKYEISGATYYIDPEVSASTSDSYDTIDWDETGDTGVPTPNSQAPKSRNHYRSYGVLD